MTELPGYIPAHTVVINKDRLDELVKIERILRAICAYNDAETLAEHLVAATDGGEIYSEEGVVRKVWVNHKLAESFRVLRKELGLSAM